MWNEGILQVDGKQVYFQAKVYDEGSQFGINNGRISKLYASVNGKVLFTYDRGWDVKPKDAFSQDALNELLAKFA